MALSTDVKYSRFIFCLLFMVVPLNWLIHQAGV